MESVVEFFEATRGLPHDFYVCSGESAPEGWQDERPGITWLHLSAPQCRNGKAATLALGERYWSGDIFVISDADMTCSEDYLEAVLGEFSDPGVGVVTCLYRARRGAQTGLGSVFESLCILDFCASVLVAEKAEGVSFAMGSTMAIRRETLEQIGGFEALEPYLADDFQLGSRSVQQGWRVAIAPTVLETGLGEPSLAEALSHQYRWMVTSRVSRPGGHVAFIITQGVLWAFLLLLFDGQLGLATLGCWWALRVLAGCLQGVLVRKSQSGFCFWEKLLLPLKDVVFLAVWFLSLRGNRVRWGSRELEIGSEGRILECR